MNAQLLAGRRRGSGVSIVSRMTREEDPIRSLPLEELDRDELQRLVEAYRALAQDRAQRLSATVVSAAVVTRPAGEAEAILNRRVVKFALAVVRPFEPAYVKVKPRLAAARARLRRTRRGAA